MPKIEDLIKKLISGDDQISEVTVGKIVALGESSSLPSLVNLFSTDVADQRWWAIRAISEFHTDEAASIVIDGLADQIISVRQCAALALTKQPQPEAIPALLENIHSPNTLLRRLVADALIALGKTAVSQLLAAISDQTLEPTSEVIRILALIEDPRTIPILMSASDKDSPIMAYWAQIGLERLGLGMTYFSLE